MKKTAVPFRDIVTGFLFLAGIFAFLCGEFIVSTMLFAFAALSGNLNSSNRLQA